MSTVTPETQLPAESANPESWIWDEHGDRVAGTFAGWDKASTKEYGSKEIIVLDVDGQRRSVWLLQEVLRSKVLRECEKRPSRDLDMGERVVITRLGPREGGNGRTYIDFAPMFPDAPPLTSTDVFPELRDGPTAPQASGDTPAEESNSTASANGDAPESGEDEIPF